MCQPVLDCWDKIPERICVYREKGHLAHGFSTWGHSTSCMRPWRHTHNGGQEVKRGKGDQPWHSWFTDDGLLSAWPYPLTFHLPPSQTTGSWPLGDVQDPIYSTWVSMRPRATVISRLVLTKCWPNGEVLDAWRGTFDHQLLVVTLTALLRWDREYWLFRHTQHRHHSQEMPCIPCNLPKSHKSDSENIAYNLLAMKPNPILFGHINYFLKKL